MVAANVDELGRRRPVCYCRPLMVLAYRTAERGRAIEAACYLREGFLQYLQAMCVVADRSNKRPKGRNALAMIKFLQQRQEVHEQHAHWLREVAKTCQRAMRCGPVRASTIRLAAEMMLIACELEQRIHFPWREGVTP